MVHLLEEYCPGNQVGGQLGEFQYFRLGPYLEVVLLALWWHFSLLHISDACLADVCFGGLVLVDPDLDRYFLLFRDASSVDFRLDLGFLGFSGVFLEVSGMAATADEDWSVPCCLLESH